ncbi:MAG: hypothetical protein ACJ75B_02925 [Flavisolibacter sp.]
MILIMFVFEAEKTFLKKQVGNLPMPVILSRQRPLDSLSSHKLQSLGQLCLRFALFNFFLVTLLGLLLRSYFFLPSTPFEYKYLLHGHSHFAFGGWIQPLLLWIILQYFPSLSSQVKYHHWRNIVALTLVSSYGMLASFPFQGYGPVSIVFSTVAVLSGYYLTMVLWKASNPTKMDPSMRILRAGLLYQVLASIGPFATGPLIAMGKAGSPLYFDSIYFYLHFQYNGWFCFLLLSVVYSLLKNPIHGKKVFLLFISGTFLSFFLSTLWNHPPSGFYILGGLGALLQLVGVLFVLKDFNKLEQHIFYALLLKLGMAAFVAKIILQTLSAIPAVADLAYQNRTFIIAYLHLVLLGFISLSGFSLMIRCLLPTIILRIGIVIFIFALFATESLLILQGMGSTIGSALFHQWLLWSFTCLFPVSSFLIMTGRKKSGNIGHRRSPD